MQKNMIFYIFLGILVLSLIAIFVLNQGQTYVNPFMSSEKLQVTIKSRTYNLEIANTLAARQKGLMNRSSLPENAGMLFVFDGTSFYPFWMKNTLIPLDIIWINSEKEVVHIKENARPCETTLEAVCNSIIPLKPALYVIELNAGEVQKLDLKTGDKIDFNLN